MRLILFGGVAGAGTTTAAALTAVHAARCGAKTLLVTLDDPIGLGGALGVAEPDGDPLDVGVGPLVACAARTGAAARARAEHAGELAALLTELGADPSVADPSVADPSEGFAPSAWTGLADLVDGGFDLVVADVGDLAALLTGIAAPEGALRRLRRALPDERRVERAVRGDGGGAPDPVVEAADRAAARWDRCAALVRGPGTSVRLVTRPGTVARARFERARRALTVLGVPVEETLGVDRPGARGPIDGVDRRIPWVPGEPLGGAALAALADAVLGGPAVTDVPALVRPPRPSPARVERHGAGRAATFTLVVDLPGLQRADLELWRDEDDLVLAGHGVCRVLPLPGALRRCRVAGARLTGGALRVAFVPDPDLWPAS